MARKNEPEKGWKEGKLFRKHGVDRIAVAVFIFVCMSFLGLQHYGCNILYSQTCCIVGLG